MTQFYISKLVRKAGFMPPKSSTDTESRVFSLLGYIRLVTFFVCLNTHFSYGAETTKQLEANASLSSNDHATSIHVDLTEAGFTPRLDDGNGIGEDARQITSPRSEAETLSFMRDLGLDGVTLNLKTFCDWFCKRYLGFKHDTLGFDKETLNPVAYNIDCANVFNFLDIHPDYFVHLNCPGGLSCDSLQEFASSVVKGIYLGLQKDNMLDDLTPDSTVRRAITIENGELRSGGEKISDLDKAVYCISPKGELYIQATHLKHHPWLLKGRPGWCAGHISTVNGKITFLSNNSGHYQHLPYHLYTLVEMLNEKAVFADNARIQSVRGAPPSPIVEEMSLEVFIQTSRKTKEELRSNWEKEIEKRIQDFTVLSYILEYGQAT